MTTQDSVGMTVRFFDCEEAIAACRRDAEHVEVQRKGVEIPGRTSG